jgi:hypothetical protein
MEGLMYGYTERTDENMDGYMDGWLDGWLDEWMVVGMDGWVDSISETILSWARID